MKVLITGGAGYIGSHVINLLGQRNHDIHIVDNLSTGRKDSILYGQLNHFGLENLPKLDSLLRREQFDACIHFAGSIVVPESIQSPIEYYRNNTINSLNLIDLCKKYHVNKFIFSSTAAVYGLQDDGICSELTNVNPINPYARSKLMTENMLEDISKISDLNYIALRYFNVAGANVDGLIGHCGPNATHLIKVACECALGKRDQIEIFGTDYPTPDGTCLRDYIHVDDLSQAHIDALEYLDINKQSHVLNCGYGKGYSVKEVISSVKKNSGVDFKVIESPRRNGDAPKIISSANKIKKILNWSPKYNDIDLIVKTAFSWEKKLK